MAKILTLSQPAQNRNSLDVRELSPDCISLRRGLHDSLECEIRGEGLYRGVTAVMLFPISHPDQWISLRYMDENEHEREIGVIQQLQQHSLKDQKYIRDSLCKQYHETTILYIKNIKHKFGQLFFMIHTNEGMKQFVTPWRSDRAEDYGANGKVILDALNNRYLIPDTERLTPRERRLLSTYIYW